MLCRAHPDSVRQGTRQESSSAHAGIARRTRSRATRARAERSGCHEAVGGGTVKERAGDGWAAVMPRVLGLQEEDIFRTIVGYL